MKLSPADPASRCSESIVNCQVATTGAGVEVGTDVGVGDGVAVGGGIGVEVGGGAGVKVGGGIGVGLAGRGVAVGGMAGVAVGGAGVEVGAGGRVPLTLVVGRAVAFGQGTRTGGPCVDALMQAIGVYAG